MNRELELRRYFGILLRKLRQKHRLKQADFARWMNLGQSALSRVEKGEQSLRVEQLLLLLERMSEK